MNGEVVSITALSCAAVNTTENFDIAIKEKAENVEIDAKNVNEIDQIDLTSQIIESSTEITSVSAETMPEPIAIADPVGIFADPIIIADPVATVAEPSAVANPVVSGKVLTEINSQNHVTINLCQTISCNSTPLNVLFDSGASLTLVNKKVAEMGINHENVKYNLNTGGLNCFEGCGTIQVPLALPDGEAHVLKALIVEKPLGQVDMNPPPPLP
jgi:hypothetical protein